MAKFLVTGTIKAGGKAQPFEKVLDTSSEKLAREDTYARFGSNAGLKRSAIKIEKVEKV